MKRKFIIFISLLYFSLILFQGCISTENPSIIYVDDDYEPSIDGWQIDHFTSIQNAINSASLNCTIFVNKGIYHENIDIYEKGFFTIIGENAIDTSIVGDKDIDNVITIGSKSKVNISGFTIQDSKKTDSNTFFGAGISLSSKNNTISGNIFFNNSCGIYTEYTLGNNIFDNKFTENNYGIVLFTGSNSNHITDNIFIKNTMGCRIKGAKYNTISSNLFSENVIGAYLCCVSNENIFYNNLFSNNLEANAQDWCLNTWNMSNMGNYWSDFHTDEQGAYDQNNDTIVDRAYNISRGYNPEEYPNKDFFPRVHKPSIHNQFLSA